MDMSKWLLAYTISQYTHSMWNLPIDFILKNNTNKWKTKMAKENKCATVTKLQLF